MAEPTQPDANRVAKAFRQLQDEITEGLQGFEAQVAFREDAWERESGSGGRTRVLEDGQVIEKGGVNFSDVHGDHMPASASAARPQLEQAPFRATGVSVVIHPRNPYAPTSHLNVRYFEAQPPGEAPVWWFGGGFDLTPIYGFEADCKAWHKAAYDCCLPYGEAIYERFKHWCDRYFYLKHRGETRGIGGIFFDDFNALGFSRSLDFVLSVGRTYLSAYSTILDQRSQQNFGLKERRFQCLRRGRYVEFNLLYDRGTLFGLESGGRTESILMSLPPVAEWTYQFQPETDSQEEGLKTDFLQPRDWLREA